MTFGGVGQIWEVMGALDQTAADAIVHRALDAGINFIRPADVYAAGESEKLVGHAIAGRRHEIVLATKVRGRMGPGPNQVGLSRLHIVNSVEASLKRLNTDYIDLYQILRSDPVTNIEDTLRALDDLVRAGKIRYIGCPNCRRGSDEGAGDLARAATRALPLHAVTTSLVGRDLERETIPLLKDQGLGLLVWSPLAGGFLSGKFTRDGGDDSARRAKFDFPPVNKERGFAILDALIPIAKAHGATVPQIALAWILANDAVTSVIIGARKIPQLDDNLKAVDVALTADEMKALDEVSKLTLEYPAWMDSLGSDRRPGERRY
jgi:aryl-alcohol dehydrogenase-like predicted oxidoreductase